jgi:hypothetical protein
VLLINNLREALYATKIGKDVVAVASVPIMKIDTWCWTLEACLDFTKPTREAVRAIFSSLDVDTQKRFTFTPRSGEWAQRARFWKEHLRDLPPNQHHEAMLKILNWYTSCVRRRLEA